MSEEHSPDTPPSINEASIGDTSIGEESGDAKADAIVVLIVFTTAVIMAVHFVSGFSFDF